MSCEAPNLEDAPAEAARVGPFLLVNPVGQKTGQLGDIRRDPARVVARSKCLRQLKNE
jgi:hypothetical protein